MANQRKSRAFKDISLSFEPHPVTKDIPILANERAIARAVRNLVETIPSERFFDSNLGTPVRELLFEHLNPMIAAVLTRKIEDVINNFEPRARLVSVRALPDLDRNAYEVQVAFYVVNTPTELVDLTIMLERLR